MPVELIGDQVYRYKTNVDKYGHPYKTPIVTKNREQLIGFVDCAHVLMNILHVETYTPAITTLSSDRFNDIMEDGRRLSEMTEEEITGYIADIKSRKKLFETSDHPDNIVDWSDYFLMVSCSCNSFFAWRTKHEIPNQNFICPDCGKVCIEYIKVEDEDIVYEGISEEEMIKYLEKDREDNEIV